MKSAFLSLILFYLNSSIYAQTLEYSGGVNQNNFFDLQRGGGHKISDYNKGVGYSFGISISNINLDTLPIRIAILFDHYNGSFYASDGGLGGASETEATVSKTSMGLGVYPLNFTVKSRFHFSMGGEFSFRLTDHFVGHKSSWLMGYPSTYKAIDNNTVSLNRDFVFGIGSRVNYDFRIIENWYISPQYKFYFGLSDEFINTEAKIKSMRHSFLIGVVWKMN